MKKYIIIGIFLGVISVVISSCKGYLDVVPDNVATLDNAFALRTEAMKFLFTCYSFMPKNGRASSDPAIVGGDAIWRTRSKQGTYFQIARGEQNIVNPAGGSLWGQLYQGIRDCNIFLENIKKVPDMEGWEKLQWSAEVKFMKAYYHFYLVKMYGPIPLAKKNIPVSTGVEGVQVFRNPVDSCFKYIIQLINEAIPDLPLTRENPVSEAGRVDKIIAYSFKAKVLVYAASPLFNGNNSEAQLKNKNGTPLFNVTYSEVKWDSAVTACKKAIDICHAAGFYLYEFPDQYLRYQLNDTIRTQLSLRNCIGLGTNGWNNEMIWANTQSYFSDIHDIFPDHITPRPFPANISTHGELAPTLNIAEMFYTNHGLPIDEDVTWDYKNRFTTLLTADDSNAYYIYKDYTSAYFNFYREPRYYAFLDFDGGVLYGHGRYDNSIPTDLFHLEMRNGQDGFGSATGFYNKKLPNFQDEKTATDISTHPYPFPIIRLAGLYLLYAEALNEAKGPDQEAYKYLDLVRERAGIPSVIESYTKYASDPTKYTTKDGLREIIHQERLNELAFEGQRFWDLRRWKAQSILNKPIMGLNVQGIDPAEYSKPIVLFNRGFGNRDYFWPIKESDLSINQDLVQNLGW